MHLLSGLVVFWAATSLAASPKLKKAEDLYDEGSFGPAKSALRLLTTDPTLTEPERAQARLYLAASEFALGDPFSAKKELQTLAVIHPELKPDPNVFLPDFVALSETVRKEAGVSEQPGGRHRKRHGEGEVAKKPPEPKPAPPPQEIAKATPPPAPEPHPAPPPSTPPSSEMASRPEKPATAPNLSPPAPASSTPPAVTSSVPDRESHGSSLRTWSYVGYGVAGAAAIVSGLFYLQAKSSAQDVAKATNPADYDTAKNSMDSKLGTSNAAGIAAAVAAGGATVLLVTSF